MGDIVAYYEPNAVEVFASAAVTTEVATSIIKVGMPIDIFGDQAVAGAAIQTKIVTSLGTATSTSLDVALRRSFDGTIIDTETSGADVTVANEPSMHWAIEHADAGSTLYYTHILPVEKLGPAFGLALTKTGALVFTVTVNVKRFYWRQH